jgi:hypothetical protein
VWGKAAPPLHLGTGADALLDDLLRHLSPMHEAARGTATLTILWSVWKSRPETTVVVTICIPILEINEMFGDSSKKTLILLVSNRRKWITRLKQSPYFHSWFVT